MSDYTAYPNDLAIQPIRIVRKRKKWFGYWGPLVDREVWAYVLTQPLKWEIGYQGSGLWIEVPSGFISDLASIPPVAWSFLNGFAPETAKAGAVHDFMRPTLTDIVTQERPPWDVQVAAGEFFHCLKADKVPKWKRKWLYLFLVYFGTRKEEW